MLKLISVVLHAAILLTTASSQGVYCTVNAAGYCDEVTYTPDAQETSQTAYYYCADGSGGYCSPLWTTYASYTSLGVLATGGNGGVPTTTSALTGPTSTPNGSPTLNSSGATSTVASGLPFNHQVVVGGEGLLTYQPNQISANIGDTVSFTFKQANHTLTQSSFQYPCAHLTDTNNNAIGIDSGFIPVVDNVTIAKQLPSLDFDSRGGHSFMVLLSAKYTLLFRDGVRYQSFVSFPSSRMTKAAPFNPSAAPTTPGNTFDDFLLNAKDSNGTTATAWLPKSTVAWSGSGIAAELSTGVIYPTSTVGKAQPTQSKAAGVKLTASGGIGVVAFLLAALV